MMPYAVTAVRDGVVKFKRSAAWNHAACAGACDEQIFHRKAYWESLQRCSRHREAGMAASVIQVGQRKASLASAVNRWHLPAPSHALQTNANCRAASDTDDVKISKNDTPLRVAQKIDAGIWVIVIESYPFEVSSPRSVGPELIFCCDLNYDKRGEVFVHRQDRTLLGSCCHSPGQRVGSWCPPSRI